MARYALVIGISEYQSPRLGNLQKPVADAEAVAQILEQYGDFQSVKRFPVRWKDQNSAELAAKKVTGVELGRELKTFLQEQAAHHEALIYFSGHGFTVYDNLGQQKGYLAASDCQVEVGENHQVIEQRHGISLDSFNELIRDSQLSSLVVLLDCCHSGYFLERQLIKQTLTAFSSQKDYYLITACRSYEDALAIKTEEYSIFTNAVLKGLAPENASKNRRVSGDRLFDYISSELKTVLQEPIRMGWGRSITLVTYPQLKSTANGEKEFNPENPYRGLYSFESEQAKYFFGREQAIRALLDRTNNNRFLAVIGASGCGKSSLVKAGLLPHLKDNKLPGTTGFAPAAPRCLRPPAPAPSRRSAGSRPPAGWQRPTPCRSPQRSRRAHPVPPSPRRWHPSRSAGARRAAPDARPRTLRQHSPRQGQDLPRALTGPHPIPPPQGLRARRQGYCPAPP